LTNLDGKGWYIAVIEKMKALVREKDTCVLATVHENEPHCSLMSYVTDPDCTRLYMATHRDTRKFHNLAGNPKVSLLIDTREGGEGADRNAVKALTVSGSFERLEDTAIRAAIKTQLLAQHPHLVVFLGDPGAEIFAVRISAFQLLDGITDSSFVAVE
jgi:nitroimidazol reductase NimA-like FMN-containing flavoprotein (pyridoxamine 5'-phosphate oxidase superfamily)